MPTGRAAAMGLAGRKRAVAEFSWDAVAAQTAALYAELAGREGRGLAGALLAGSVPAGSVPADGR